MIIMTAIKYGFIFRIIFLGVLLLILPSVSSAYQTASLNKIVYVINDTMIITGTTSTENVSLTATIYGSGSSVASLSNTSNGTSFYFYRTLNFSAGSYYVSVSDGSSSVDINFSIVAEKLYSEAHLISSTDIKNISTSTLITSDTQSGGNFGELRNLSLSRTLHYGNATIENKLYHFVLLDQNYNMTYDTLYVDDDNRFLLYNDSEDSGNESYTEKALKKGDAFKGYIIGEVEFYTGNKTILAVPMTTSAYQSGYVHFIVLTKNSNGVLLSNQNVTLRLLNSTGGVVNSTSITTNGFGYYVTNFSVPSAPGAYTIDLNSGMGTEVFSVESFKLYGKITDTSDSPTYSFAPNPNVRINAVAKSGGNPVSLTVAQAVIYYPNGTIRTVSLSNTSVGVYSYDIDLSGAPNGEYGVKIVGTYSSNQQEFRMGFAIESVQLEIMAINPAFMDKATEGPGAMVSAFAPGSNITLVAALSNISAGGMFKQGPPGEESGIIDIDERTTATIDECASRISILELMDDRGFAYNPITDFNYSVVNLSTAVAGFNMPAGEGPSESMMRQCMIIIRDFSKKGSYRLSVQINYNGEKKIAGSSFDIQRVIASGDTVDFKGDDFGFFAPNSTVRIKLKIIDMLTHNELPVDNITNAKIIEMQKEYPTYRDISVQNLSESVVNGTIQFTSPNEEGFFSMKFRFKADVAGSIESGVGTAFFQLKKYMIWGNIPCQRQPCYVASSKNVTLDVTVVDIDKGSMMDLGMSTGLTCTDCQGLIVNVSKLRNDQLMKEITDYSVVTGVITNSSNPTVNITILPNAASSMPTGWYGVDLILTDPTNANNTYFGFAWFEIRNFYVDMIPITAAQGNLTGMWQEPSYAIGQSILFGIIPRNPTNPEQILSISAQPSVESVKWATTWPPPEVSFNSSVTYRNVSILGCPDCQPTLAEIWVVNISGLSKSGNHQANVRVNVSGYGSDIGTFWFSLSSFKVSAQYRGMESWPPVFSNSENLTVRFTGCEFGDGCTPHNLSYVKPTIFDRRRDEPMRLNYTTICVNNNCTLNINLSGLSLNGKYEVSFKVNDTAGNMKETGMEFVIRAAIVSVPRIEQAWIWYTDTTKRELNLDNDRDRCDNQKNLQNDNCGGPDETVCLWGGSINITVNGSYNENFGNVFCLGSNGWWDDRGPGGCGGDSGITIYVVSNTTHIWLNTTTNLRFTASKTVGDTFNLGGKTWNITSISDNSFRVKHANNLICGEAWTCSNNGCTQSTYTLLPPSNYSEFYHGYVNLVGDNNVGNNLGPGFDSSRYVYMYHNKTHLWVSSGTNMSSVTPIAVNSIGSFNGTWKVTLLNKQQVELEGQDVLANTGAYIINTSLSRSGVFKIGKLEEYQFGSWNKESGQRNGMDLNGDGQTNGSAYFIITDNATSGIYDTFIFSTNNNFTNIIPISANRTTRTFGLGDKLTLLNIDPRASNIRFYSNQTGDWSDLGEYRIGTNITIPIVVSAPSGSGVTRNVSVEWIKRRYGGMELFTNITPIIREINYLGELSINVSSYGQGEFVFQISAGDTLEEWKWPRATTRTFLVDSETGYGGYINNFKSLPLTRYDWENYGDVKEIYSANWTSNHQYFSAVFSFDAGQDRIVNETTPMNYAACHFAAPASAGSGANITMRSNELSNPQYYFYLTDANVSKVWVKSGDCNFNGSTVYSVNSEINLTRDGKTYAMRILNANRSTQSIITGLANFNESLIRLLRIDSNGINEHPSNKWRIMALNISGVNYNVVLANDTVDYPMCSVWSASECAKKAWFNIGSDFSSSIGVRIGENFTQELYLAKIGTGPWDGIIIANFSQVSQKPAVDVRTRDNTTSYFNALSESALGIDLNLDNAFNQVFYVVTFDSKDDGLQNLTDLVSDDDANITEDWWSQNINGQDYYKDFYNNETGMREQRNSLPRGISNGNIRFGEMNNSLPWEQNPEWEILVYNNTDMLIKKSKWMINSNDNVTLIVKAYNFDQTPTQGANLTLTSIMRTGFGFQILNSNYYTLDNVQNVTDQYGYGIIKLAPAGGSWSSGEYMITAEVRYGGSTETINQWFRVGSW
jgi:hypothetical protein